MKVIKVDSKASCSAIILTVLCAIIWIAFVAYSIFYLSDYSIIEGEPKYVLAVIGTPFALLGLCFIPLVDKKTYLSEMILYDDRIELIYKKRYKIEYRRTIYKNEILEFYVLTGFLKNENTIQGDSECALSVTIKLKDREPIRFNQTTKLFDNNNFLMDILKVQQEIPNFKYETTGYNEFANAYINYFIRFGKRLPVKKQFLYSLKKSTPALISLVAMLVLFLILMLAAFLLFNLTLFN